MVRFAVCLAAVATLLIAGFAPFALAGIDEKAQAFVLCKNKKDVRTVRVLNDKENCKVTYTKSGSEEIVGGNRLLGHCKSVLKSIQTNLENAKFSCRTVQSASIVSSAEVIRQ